MNTQTKTLSVRIKDKHAPLLRKMAYEVNQVWNIANAAVKDALSNAGEVGPKQPVILTWQDVQKVTNGISKERGWNINSFVVNETVKQHGAKWKKFRADRKAALKKNPEKKKRKILRWRKSTGSERSLGWIPFKVAAAQWQNGCVKFAGHYFKVWDSYGLSKYQFRAGNFAEDSRGRWYFNICVQVETAPGTATTAVGVDLGLKDYATPSHGDKLEAAKFYRSMEKKLGAAQRANKKNRVRAIHAKIKNRRKDALHKFSTALVNSNAAIFVGDVSASKLAKTKMAKSVLDAGWSMLKTQLEYKAIARSVVFMEVNESYSTQACSCCGAISDNSPKGRPDLRIREWTCCECGTAHDRDVNAAKNILAAGHRRLAVGIPVL